MIQTCEVYCKARSTSTDILGLFWEQPTTHTLKSKKYAEVIAQISTIALFIRDQTKTSAGKSLHVRSIESRGEWIPVGVITVDSRVPLRVGICGLC